MLSGSDRWEGAGLQLSGRSDCRLAALLVQEGLGTGRVSDELLVLEPQGDLALGVLQGVAAVDDVPEESRDLGNDGVMKSRRKSR